MKNSFQGFVYYYSAKFQKNPEKWLCAGAHAPRTTIFRLSLEVNAQQQCNLAL
jgi:hypothetical protein